MASHVPNSFPAPLLLYFRNMPLWFPPVTSLTSSQCGALPGPGDSLTMAAGGRRATRRVGPRPGPLPSGSDCGFCSTGWGLLARRGGEGRKGQRRGQPQPGLRSCQCFLNSCPALQALGILSTESLPTVTHFQILLPPHYHPSPAMFWPPDSREDLCQARRTSWQQRRGKATSSQGLRGRGGVVLSREGAW